MLTFYNSQNQVVKLLKELGRGGEGTVYASENETLVGKIYHEPISDEKAEKLRWMAAHNNEQLLKTTAWIAEILTDEPNGKVVGFLMPKIKAKEIHELYSPKSRRVYFPDATWHFLVHTATNLARAFHNLHKDNHVMGDVNQGNCVVTADGTVKLIDCDSYEITTAQKIYSCEVGVTTHIPPELQGRNLRGIDRSDNHDNFGLAVIIFQLLFLGRHPFAGNYQGAEDKTIEDAIREHLFVYGKDATKKRVVQPPGTPALATASTEVAELFERAFARENNRPKPHEWIKSLENLGSSLQQCLLNPGHVFYTKLAVCPWCEIEENTGLMLFPFTVSGGAAGKNYERIFDVPTVKKLVASFDVSGTFASLFSEDIEVVEPSKGVLQKRDIQIFVTLLICVVYLVGMIYFHYVLESCFLPVAVIGALVTWAFISNMEFDAAFQNLKLNEETKFESLSYEKNKIETEFFRHLGQTQLPANLSLIQKKLNSYEQNNAAKDTKLLTANSESNLRLQNEITDLLVNLRLNSVKSRRKIHELKARSKDIIENLPTISANVKAMKWHLPFNVAFIVTNVLLFVLFSKGMLPVDKKNQSPNYSNSTRQIVTTAAPPTPQKIVNIPDESITDQQISDYYSTAERREIVEELISKSYATLDLKDNQDAQNNLKFALRFDKDNAVVLSLLGRALHNAENYTAALKQFKAATEINPKIVDKFYLGMTLLELKKYKEAREAFQQLNSENLSAAGLYNLGEAYMGLKDYETASQTYGMALKMDPGDTDSLYQLGICFSKMKDEAGVKDTYATLKALNSPRAEELRKAVGKTIKLESSDDEATQILKERGILTTGDEPPPPPPVKKN